MGGEAVAQVVKRPSPGDVRVHPEYGGVSVLDDLGDAPAALALDALRRVALHFPTDVPYGRVDLLWLDGSWVVSELELTEPSLYVEVAPVIATAYADAIVTYLSEPASRDSAMGS